MSMLYGVKNHARMNRVLKKYKNYTFCDCHLTEKQKKRQLQRRQKLQYYKIHDELTDFFQEHHLCLYGTERKIEFGELNGRVDCICKQKSTRNTLFILDWKFSTNRLNKLSFDYILQMNLYKYIMNKMDEFKKFDIQMFCCIFIDNIIHIFSCEVLDLLFIENFLSNTSFK